MARGSTTASSNQVSEPTIIKKYSNRRLYDTEESCYITLGELADKIRHGREVRVVGAKSGEDLTKSTLAQILFDEREIASHLPVSLLAELIRLDDHSMAEFFARYVTTALEIYLQAGESPPAERNSRASMPLAVQGALPAAWAASPSGASRAADNTPAWVSKGREDTEELTRISNALASLRGELEELRELILEDRENSPGGRGTGKP